MIFTAIPLNRSRRTRLSWVLAGLGAFTSLLAAQGETRDPGAPAPEVAGPALAPLPHPNEFAALAILSDPVRTALADYADAVEAQVRWGIPYTYDSQLSAGAQDLLARGQQLLQMGGMDVGNVSGEVILEARLRFRRDAVFGTGASTLADLHARNQVIRTYLEPGGDPVAADGLRSQAQHVLSRWLRLAMAGTPAGLPDPGGPERQPEN